MAQLVGGLAQVARETHAVIVPSRHRSTQGAAATVRGSRSSSTGIFILMSVRDPSPFGAGFVRNIPARPWLRASVGAWNDADDLDRLLGTLST